MTIVLWISCKFTCIISRWKKDMVSFCHFPVLCLQICHSHFATWASLPYAVLPYAGSPYTILPYVCTACGKPAYGKTTMANWHVVYQSIVKKKRIKHLKTVVIFSSCKAKTISLVSLFYVPNHFSCFLDSI